MLEEKDIELINRALDGELDPQEQASLEDLLANNADAQALHQDLSRIDLLLQRAPASEPPRDIAAGVKARLSNKTTASRPSKRMKMAWAIAASLFIAAGILNFGGNTGDEEDIVGTLVGVNHGVSPYIYLQRKQEHDWSIVIDIESSAEFRLLLDNTDPNWHINSSNIKELTVTFNDPYIEISGSGPFNITLPLKSDESVQHYSMPVINGVLEFDGQVFKGRLYLEKNR